MKFVIDNPRRKQPPEPAIVPQADGERVAHLFDLASLARPVRSDNEARIRGLCHNAFLGGEMSICRVLGRYKMFVDTGDIGLSTHLLIDGYWKMWTTEAMQRVVRPGSTAVDVGANLGYFTLLLADLVGTSGQVHAFEPNPAILARLRRSVAVNGFAGRTLVHDTALSDAEGEACLVVPPGEPKNGHLSAPCNHGIIVRRRRLDSYDVVPDFIKIDVEGAEEAVWRGMTRILAAPRPLTIFIEYALDRHADPGLFLDQTLHHGFSLSRLDPESGILPATRDAVLAAHPTATQLLVLSR